MVEHKEHRWGWRLPDGGWTGSGLPPVRVLGSQCSKNPLPAQANLHPGAEVSSAPVVGLLWRSQELLGAKSLQYL